MTLILKQLFSFVRLLNSDTGTRSIAMGIACGLILGFAPVFSLQTVLVILVLFFFRIQIGAATIAAFFFSIPAYLLDPAFDWVGSRILEFDAFEPVFTELYHMPIVPLTRFNNSVVMGAGVISILLFPLAYWFGVQFVDQYRATVVARFRGSKFFSAMKSTKFYQWYVKYDEYTSR